jgi:hypothetical protein
MNALMTAQDQAEAQSFQGAYILTSTLLQEFLTYLLISHFCVYNRRHYSCSNVICYYEMGATFTA